MGSASTTRIVASVAPSERSPAQVASEFRRLLRDGAKLRVAGEARRRPLQLLSRGYTPKYKIELFDTCFYLTDVRQDAYIRYFVAYVVPGGPRGRRREIHARVFYKDVSLQWRAASHFVRSDGENWIGKGDVRRVVAGGYETLTSAEETTDLPLEMQSALEVLIRRVRKVRTDARGVALVLRRAPKDRIEAYRDFTAPRRRAQADRRNWINGGRSIARFIRKHDPTSLRFVPGFEPDFAAGIVEHARSDSRLYGGAVDRFRILSRNRKVQYLFLLAPRHAWIIPPQATTCELTSYGVRTIDVVADEDLFVPGYEYHYVDDDEDPPVLVSQIPEGFVGATSELDASRADASAWLDPIPVIAEFRRRCRGLARRAIPDVVSVRPARRAAGARSRSAGGSAGRGRRARGRRARS